MFSNAFMLAIRAVLRNRLRSFLTILGVVIGVAAVVILVTVGGGVTAKVADDMAKLGTNLLLVRPGQFRGPGGGASDARRFSLSDVDAIRREVPDLSGVALIPWSQAKFGNGAIGGALSYVITEAGIFVSFLWVLKSAVLDGTSASTFLKVLFAGSAMAFSAWWFNGMFLLIPISIGAAVYGGLIILLGLFPSEFLSALGRLKNHAGTRLRGFLSRGAGPE